MSCSVPHTSTMHLSHFVFTIITMVNITKFTDVVLCTLYLYHAPNISPSSLMSHSVPHTSTIHLSHFVFTEITMVNITKFTKVTLCTSYLYYTPITFCIHYKHHGEHHQVHCCCTLYCIPIPCIYHILCSSQSPCGTSPPLSLMLCSVPYTSAMHLSQFAIQSLSISLQFIHG